MNLLRVWSVLIILVLSTLHESYEQNVITVLENVTEAEVIVSENVTEEEENTCDRNIVIVVIGKSGAGISSLIRQIFGTTELPNPGIGDFPVTEYTIKLDGGSTLTFLDVMGLVDGKTIENEAKILASLKSYLNNPSKLKGIEPDAFLIVSNFDDNRFIGDQSQFTQTVKRVHILQEVTFGSSHQIYNIFVMTRFMSTTRAVQRRPQQRIISFQQAIQNFTSISPPIHLLVGENMADSDNILPDGYIKLANKEIYPKNVLTRLIELLKDDGDGDCAKLLENFRDNRNKYTERIGLGSNSEDDPVETQNFITRLQATSFEIQETEINKALRQAFDAISNPVLKDHIRSSIPMLQIHLQSQNITQLSQLPQWTLDKVKFIQHLPKNLEIGVLALLQTSMDNFLPEFVQNTVTGSSYDVISDEILPFSPFKGENLAASSTGYLLPSYIICTKLPTDPSSIVDHTHSADSYQEYIGQRLHFLDFSELRTIFNKSCFEGKMKAGFNLKPEVNDDLPSISTRRELRKFHFQLNEDKFELTDEFLQSVSSLEPLDLSKRDSVGDWKAFFNKHGTHVVSSAYVGGTVQGFLLDEILTSLTPNQRQSILQEIINFQPIRTKEKPNYQFFGGDRMIALSQLSSEGDRTVTNEVKEAIVKEWVDSITYDPIGLDYEIKLFPIGDILLRYNTSAAKEIKKVSNLLLAGQLVYTRLRKNSTKSGRNKTNTENVIQTTTTELNLLDTTVRNYLLDHEISIPETSIATPEHTPSIGKPTSGKGGNKTRGGKGNKNKTNTINKNATPPPFDLLNDLTVTKRPVLQLVQKNYTFPSTPIIGPEFYANQTNLNSSVLIEFTESVRNRQEQHEKLLQQADNDRQLASKRQEEERKLEIEKRKVEALEYEQQIKEKKRNHDQQIKQIELDYKFMTEERKRQAESDRKRMQERFQIDLYNMQQRHKEQEAILKSVIEQNERDRKEQEKGGCLRKGTRILMADGTEKRVEELVVGDIVLDHELNQVKVIGHLEKFLLGDHFYGFSENGPFFFTNTHLLVGPGEYNGEVQLWVNSFHDFIEENPLMEYLNVKQINKTCTTYFTVDTESRIVRKTMSMFRDPSTSPPDTMVHIIEVDSPHGTYFANGVACRHEIPPFERWPNTVSLFLRIRNSPEIHKLTTMSYTLDVVHQIDEIVERIGRDMQFDFLRKCRQLLDSNTTHSITAEHVQNQHPSQDIIIDAVFGNPIFSHFISKLYGRTGKIISSILDNPSLDLTPIELGVLERYITNVVMEKFLL